MKPTMLLLLLITLSVCCVWALPIFSSFYTPAELTSMRQAKWVNYVEISKAVGFDDPNENPYPARKWYDVSIDYSQSCYIRFIYRNHSHYELITSSVPPPSLPSGGEVFLTHLGPCGVCSSIADLEVYLSRPHLTGPVRKCALRMFSKPIRSCIEDIGFSEQCSWIWYWNTKNTAKFSSSGGCFGICIANLGKPYNEPVGFYNPCEPEPEQLLNVNLPEYFSDKNYRFNHPFPEEHPMSELENIQELAFENGVINSQYTAPNARFCLPACSPFAKGNCIVGQRRQRVGSCGNTINRQPSCHPDQYRNNPYRLNPCLQCDECRSGPIFKKVAGRTRRNSGIKSAIDRPGVPEILHHYFSGV